MYALGVKLEVVSYYGKNGKPQCCWEGCVVNDVDMLTIDHINNDGYKENPSQRAGMGLYHKLRKENFPSGYQTLCSNHQLKKETLRRRSEGRREYKIKE